MTEYQMQDICSNLSSIFSLIYMEIAKTATSFCFFEVVVDVIAFLFASIVLDMTHVFYLVFVFVFLCNLNHIDLSGLMAPLVAYITFVFLGSLSLRLTYISRRGVVGLSFIFIFILVLPTCFVFFFLNQ